MAPQRRSTSPLVERLEDVYVRAAGVDVLDPVGKQADEGVGLSEVHQDAGVVGAELLAGDVIGPDHGSDADLGGESQAGELGAGGVGGVHGGLAHVRVTGAVVH